MNLRRYEDKDNEELKNMLSIEGIEEDKMMYKNDIVDTFVLEDEGVVKGFFTIRNEWNFPSLQHFAVRRGFRSPALARELAKLFEGVLKFNKLGKAIIHATNEKSKKFIEYYWKKKPYSYKDNRYWYLVDI